jgi:hypothetical protein
MKLTPCTEGNKADQPTYSFNRAPRCGARTRAGNACLSPAVHGKKRCRMHGGARGSGAPIGSQNAMKHGGSTKVTKEFRKSTNIFIKLCSKFISDPEIKKFS